MIQIYKKRRLEGQTSMTLSAALQEYRFVLQSCNHDYYSAASTLVKMTEVLHSSTFSAARSQKKGQPAIDRVEVILLANISPPLGLAQSNCLCLVFFFPFFLFL